MINSRDDLGTPSHGVVTVQFDDGTTDITMASSLEKEPKKTPRGLTSYTERANSDVEWEEFLESDKISQSTKDDAEVDTWRDPNANLCPQCGDKLVLEPGDNVCKGCIKHHMDNPYRYTVNDRHKITEGWLDSDLDDYKTEGDMDDTDFTMYVIVNHYTKKHLMNKGT